MLKKLSVVAFVAIGLAAYSTLSKVDAEDKKTELPKPDAEGFITIFNGTDLTGWEGLADYWEVKERRYLRPRDERQIEADVPDLEGKQCQRFRIAFEIQVRNQGREFGHSVPIEVLVPRTSGLAATRLTSTLAADTMAAFMTKAASPAAGHHEHARREDGLGCRYQCKNEKLGEKDLKKVIKVGDWNDVVLRAEGNHITYSINGELMTDLIDESPKVLKEGVLALQCHAGFTMDIQFKDIKIKLLESKLTEKK